MSKYTAGCASQGKLKAIRVEDQGIVWFYDTKDNYDNDNIDWFYKLLEEHGESILRISTYNKHKDVIIKKYPNHTKRIKDNCIIVKIF